MDEEKYEVDMSKNCDDVKREDYIRLSKIIKYIINHYDADSAIMYIEHLLQTCNK